MATLIHKCSVHLHFLRQLFCVRQYFYGPAKHDVIKFYDRHEVHKNTTHHYVELVGALSLFICNEPGPNDTQRVFVTSGLLPNLVLVAVTAENRITKMMLEMKQMFRVLSRDILL